MLGRARWRARAARAPPRSGRAWSSAAGSSCSVRGRAPPVARSASAISSARSTRRPRQIVSPRKKRSRACASASAAISASGSSSASNVEGLGDAARRRLRDRRTATSASPSAAVTCAACFASPALVELDRALVEGSRAAGYRPPPVRRGRRARAVPPAIAVRPRAPPPSRNSAAPPRSPRATRRGRPRAQLLGRLRARMRPRRPRPARPRMRRGNGRRRPRRPPVPPAPALARGTRRPRGGAPCGLPWRASRRRSASGGPGGRRTGRAPASAGRPARTALPCGRAR